MDQVRKHKKLRGGEVLEDTEPPLPGLATPAWNAFSSLHRTRGGGMGVTAIQYGEIKAYFDVVAPHLTGWDAELIRNIDDKFLEIRGQEDGGDSQTGRPSGESGPRQGNKTLPRGN